MMLKTFILALFGATLFTGVAAAQSNCASYPYPNALSNGSTADGGQVYANFTAIQNCANYSLAPLANPHFTGSVGIGTTSPVGPLSLGNPYSDTTLRSYSNSDQGVLAFYQAQNFPTTNAYQRTLDIMAGGLNAGGNIRFLTQAINSSAVAAMLINPSGNVGIGTTNPIGLLSLNLASASGNVSSWDNTYAIFGAAGVTTGSAVGIGYNSSSDYGEIRSVAPGTSWKDLYIRGKDDVFFYQNSGGASAEGMRIAAGSGNVGIGTSSPVSPLEVHEATNQNITFFSNSGGWTGAAGIQSVNDVNGAFEPLGFVASQFFFDASTGVGINTTSLSGYTLLVAGPAGGTTNWTNISDARLKKNVAEIPDALSLVKRLRGVRYDWRPAGEREVGKDLNLPTDEKQIGFIAQEVATVVPEAVVPPKTEVKYRDKGGKETTVKLSDSVYGLKEAALVPVLVEAIKEQQAAIEKQQSEIETLKGEVAALKSDKPSTR